MANENKKQNFKKEDIPIVTQTRVVNGLNYEIGITLFSFFSKKQYILYQESIVRIIIENDLECFTPKIRLSYKDINNVYTNGHEMVGQFLRVVIKEPDSESDEKVTPKYFDNIYMITRAEIIDFAVSYTIYEIEAVHESIINLSRHVNYATSKDLSPISPYKIITDILKKVNIDINDNNVAKTNRKIHYITTQEQTVKDIIKYCLAAGVDKEIKPAFYFWNIKLNTPYVWSVDLDMGEEDQYYANSALSYYTNSGGNISTPDSLIRNVQMINANPVPSFIQQSGLDIVWNYDQLSRTWSQEITTAKRIKENLSPVPEQEKKEIKSNFHIYGYETYGIRHYHPNYDFLTLYKKYRDLTLGTNSLELISRGSIIREVGQTIRLNCEDPNLSPLIGGPWKVYRMLHIFEGNFYTNSMVLFRTFSMLEKPK